MRSIRLISAVLAAASLTAAAAHAQGPSRKERVADTLFQSAKVALEKGDLVTACAQFAESQRLDPAAGTLLNLGECEERSGKVATALAHFKEARASLVLDDFRIPFTDARIAGLSGRVPRLTLKLAGPEAPATSVTCDDREVAQASLGQPLPVDPGLHVCVVRAPGHVESRAERAVREGEAQTLELTVGAVLPELATEELSSRRVLGEPREQTAGSGGSQRTMGLVVGGAGVVGVALGGIFGLVAKSTYDGALSNDCKGAPSACSAAGVSAGQSAHDQATVSTVAFIAGGALLAGGGLLYFTAPKAGSVRVAPTVGSKGAGLSLLGVW
jgi:hypothetical protein